MGIDYHRAGMELAGDYFLIPGRREGWKGVWSVGKQFRETDISRLGKIGLDQVIQNVRLGENPSQLVRTAHTGMPGDVQAETQRMEEM